MDKPTAPFREEHRHLLSHVEHLRQAAREIPRLSIEERETIVERILEFLRGTLSPHAEAEERFLYPEVARLIGNADATAPMTHDHVAIRTLGEALAETDPSDVATLQELLYGLHALISVHFRKEEDIYLPLLDEQPPDLTKAILDRMGEPAHTG